MRGFLVVFFFFKQKTAYEMRISDWSSDVCSSDLIDDGDQQHALPRRVRAGADELRQRGEEEDRDLRVQHGADETLHEGRTADAHPGGFRSRGGLERAANHLQADPGEIDRADRKSVV